MLGSRRRWLAPMYNAEIRIRGYSTVKRGGLYQARPCSQRVPGLSELLEQDIAAVSCLVAVELG
jgi:hypothetical protein